MFVRAELKRRAKEVLSRKYLKLFVACLLLYWLGNGIGNFKIFQINFNFSGPTAQWLDAITVTLFGKTYSGLSSLMTLFGPLVLMYTLLSAAVAALIRLIVLNPLSFGLMNYMKKASTDEENANDVFRCFNQWEDLKRVALTGFWRDLIVFLYSLLFVIPGIVKSYSYRFVPYLTEDEPDLDPQQILALSQEMTQGIKLDLFVLDLSFFLWYLLGAVTFNIGTYFIRPYINQTDAECYLEVRNQYYGGTHENWD